MQLAMQLMSTTCARMIIEAVVTHRADREPTAILPVEEIALVVKSI